jgi:hypothetical protein
MAASVELRDEMAARAKMFVEGAPAPAEPESKEPETFVRLDHAAQSGVAAAL